MLYRSRIIHTTNIVCYIRRTIAVSNQWCLMSKHHFLPNIQSLDSTALLFTANHITACSTLVAASSAKLVCWCWVQSATKAVTVYVFLLLKPSALGIGMVRIFLSGITMVSEYYSDTSIAYV